MIADELPLFAGEGRFRDALFGSEGVFVRIAAGYTSSCEEIVLAAGITDSYALSEVEILPIRAGRVHHADILSYRVPRKAFRT